MLLFLISLLIVSLTAVALIRKFNPQGVLLAAGICMCIIALVVGGHELEIKTSSGSVIFNFIKLIEETFLSNISRAGLMIMTIGGYVAFMNHINATHTLVRISMKPLAFFRKCPLLAAVLTIPIGQLLFITTPSATGLGLLLVASVYPILNSLGVSRLTALSMIAATTIFDQGPGSANTALASELVGENNVEYFITHQLPLVLPTSCIVMLTFYFFNQYFDKKDKRKALSDEPSAVVTPTQELAPAYFALFPVLPLVLLVLLSPYVGLFDNVRINTTMAMFFSLLAVLVIVAVQKRSVRKAFEAFSAFWKGMGNVFGSVVTLIVASEIFSKGLIQMGFVDSLIAYSTHVGLTGVLIAILFTVMIFSAAMLMGSGNAAFFSFGPLLPEMAQRLGMPAISLVLPMQLASSMGRAASPIAGIIVAIAGVVGASPIDLAKRNTLPLIISIASLLVFHFIVTS